MPTCTKCHTEKPVDDFPTRTDQGVVRRRRHCRICRNAMQNSHKERNAAQVRKKQEERRELLRGMKDAPCADCGGRFHFSAMDFDHRPGETKEFNIMKDGLTRALDKVLAEVAKCDVICANCHRVRTFERRQ